MKKWITIICAIAMVMTTVTGCGGKETPTPVSEVQTGTEQAETPSTTASGEKTKFTMGFDASFPPYGYVDEAGEYVGFDIDLATEVCNRLGWELVKQAIDWDSKDMELSSGSIDCIWNGFTKTEERAEMYTWSSPYVDNSQVFVVAKDSGIKTKADLAGKVVAVQADSSALEALSDGEGLELAGTFTELMQVPEYNTAFMNLEAGAVDAVAMDIGVANYQMTSRGEGYVILEDALSTEVYAIGFLLGEEGLRDTVQAELDAMAADGTFMKIAEKWGLQDSVILGK